MLDEDACAVYCIQYTSECNIVYFIISARRHDVSQEFEFSGNEFLPLREVVYQTLRKSILTEKLRPGERLMENTIATKLGVSRTPVREAIRMLSDEGLVLIIPRRGAQVAEISRQELTDVLEIRRALEELATGKACDNMSQALLKELKSAEEDFRVRTSSASLPEIAEADEAFHEVIYRAAGNRRLITTLNHLREQMYRFRFEYLKQPGILTVLVDEHASITKAIEERDKETAVRLIAAHIDNQQKEIERALMR